MTHKLNSILALCSAAFAISCSTGSCAAPSRKAPPPKVQLVTVFPSTRGLFQYRRNDVAPGKLTTISLNTAHVAASPVSPNVFGNFIENLHTVIYDSLWADTLHNPGLEKIDDKDGEAQWWDQTGSAVWRDSEGFQSPRCVRLSGQDGTLSQRVFLPVTRTRAYTLTLYARAASGVPGKVSVIARAGGEKDGGFQAGEERAGLPLTNTEVSVTGSDWHKHALHWVLPVNSIAKGQSARFVISHISGGAVDVDQISLFPDDAVHNFDPDALKAAQVWNIPILRFSGNYSSGYHWRDGVGPRASRPTMRNIAWGGVDSHHFGTGEFLDLCHLPRCWLRLTRRQQIPGTTPTLCARSRLRCRRSPQTARAGI